MIIHGEYMVNYQFKVKNHAGYLDVFNDALKHHHEVFKNSDSRRLKKQIKTDGKILDMSIWMS